MKVELFPFQEKAMAELRTLVSLALGEYRYTRRPQVISFTAPTGAGKTIIMASLVESIFFGYDRYSEQPEAIFVWLSDSPNLNKQSMDKFILKADKIRPWQCVMISEESFDRDVLEDGHIYFLNTQKLGKSGNLTKHGERRNFTIWETLANTVANKSDRLYFIIDEAHRGAIGREADRATTIMQKFLKGSPDDGLPPMPVVIGMSATTERFNKLVEGLTPTLRQCVVTPDDVRASGLLKDRIVITYPEASAVAKEMGVLEAAAIDWKEKCEHWAAYCKEQNYAQVDPVFVVQVQNVGENKISDTDLDECLRIIKDRTGFSFKEGEVVHSFGDPADITINGLKVRYEEPSRISDDHKIKVVFFKESLSTGWDCPRAETMMSFRRAVDSTYIAQLLGRMVRTPLQMRIQVDEVLNDVHLFLPNFDEKAVNQIVETLQGEIPTPIIPGPPNKNYEDLTIHAEEIRKSKKKKNENPDQIKIFGGEQKEEQKSSAELQPEKKSEIKIETEVRPETEVKPETKVEPVTHSSESEKVSGFSATKSEESEKPTGAEKTEEPENFEEPEISAESFDRAAVLKFINESGLLTYSVKSEQINDYLMSMYRLAHFLCQSGLYPSAAEDVHSDIVAMIRDHVERLKRQGEYDEMVEQVKRVGLQSQVIDPYGETVKNFKTRNLFSTSGADIDRQFRFAESQLGNDGVGLAYGRKFDDPDDPDAYMIDVVLFASESECMGRLKSYAEAKFHKLSDDYRRPVARMNSERHTRQFNAIISNGGISERNFYLPETILFQRDKDAKECTDHLFVNTRTGTAKIRLNSWEEGTLEEERQRDDFVCWIRNSARAAWALAIPYKYNGMIKPTYPDLLIVRREGSGFVLDILEPHMPKYDDNLGKAIAFARYARHNNLSIGRIQLIRQADDATRKKRFKRLDMCESAVCEKVIRAASQDELNHIFDEYGSFATENRR